MKTICYIDASNLMKTGYKVDHKRLFDFLKNRFSSEKIVYCGALFVGDFYREHDFINDDYLDIKKVKDFFENSKEEYKKNSSDNIKKTLNQIKFINKLSNIGFETKIKPLKIMSNGKRKADCDVNITVEGMKDYSIYDKIILFSGDGNFLPFLRFLKTKEREIQVFSFRKSTAREIKDFVGGNWHDLDEKGFRNKLERKSSS